MADAAGAGGGGWRGRKRGEAATGERAGWGAAADGRSHGARALGEAEASGAVDCRGARARGAAAAPAAGRRCSRAPASRRRAVRRCSAPPPPPAAPGAAPASRAPGAAPVAGRRCSTAFRLPPSAFRLPPSAFRLPPPSWLLLRPAVGLQSERNVQNKHESLYEDEEFDQRQLAALVVSKVFYYLGDLNDSLSYALGAGPLFDVSEDLDYTHALLAKALDEYASIKTRASKATEEEENVDPRLEAIVERMLEKCILDGKYQQATGMAVECRRLDKLEEAIVRCDNIHGALLYCINLSHQYVNHREYRCEVLRYLVKIYQTLPNPDYLSICQCLMSLGEPETIANILDKLLSGSKDDALLAYQIAFDLVENENQAFL